MIEWGCLKEFHPGRVYLCRGSYGKDISSFWVCVWLPYLLRLLFTDAHTGRSVRNRAVTTDELNAGSGVSSRSEHPPIGS